MNTTSRALALSVFLAAGHLGGGGAAAQSGSSTLAITVRSAEDLRPLAGARVLVEGIGRYGITDQAGFLSLAGLPAGGRSVEVRYLGYATKTEPLAFEAGRTTTADFQMTVQPIELAGVRVEPDLDILALRGFYDRQRGGQGTYFTREDIIRTRPRHLSDILRRMAGISVGSSDFRPSAAIRGPGRNCPIQFFLDGTLASGFNIDEVGPDDVEGLEIYRGASTIPPAYNKGTAPCGVILIWTRID